MERKRYLEICQRNAVNGDSVLVSWKGIRYYPRKLFVWFDKNGRTMNTAQMVALIGDSAIEARLEELEEIKNES
jgi:hypothetical protein